jgi:hypothetical protein
MKVTDRGADNDKYDLLLCIHFEKIRLQLIITFGLHSASTKNSLTYETLCGLTMNTPAGVNNR